MVSRLFLFRLDTRQKMFYTFPKNKRVAEMILIIDKNRKRGLTIAEIFHYMGILSLYTSPKDATARISSEYRAILVSSPEELPDALDYVNTLRKYSGKMPIFSVSAEGYSSPIFDKCFPDDISSSVLVSEIITLQEEMGLPSLGKYLLSGLDAGCDIGEVRYFSEKLNFTKTETMIIRYLIVMHPTLVKAEDIMKHSHNPLKTALPEGIRTHISKINSKFKKAKGRNLITSIPSEGYAILTPLLKEKV